MTVKEIFPTYSNHLSIRKIKNLCVPENKFDLSYPSTSAINETIKWISVNKAQGPDDISAKFVKMSANIIDSSLVNLITNDIGLNEYSKLAKTTKISQIT